MLGVCWFLNFGATLPAKNPSRLIYQCVNHPVHVSFTTIEYFKDESKYKILFKIFVDDFDLILKMKYGKDLQLIRGRWEKNYHKIITKYVYEHFSLNIGKKNKLKNKLNLKKNEIKEQAIWLHYDLEIDNFTDEDIIIQNTLMMDLYPDQKNLLIFVEEDKEQAIKFDLKNKTQIIQL